MKPRRTLSIYVLLVGVMGLSIVGGVLAFQIFAAVTETQLTPEQTELIRPLDGTISETVIENLQQRTSFSAQDFEVLRQSLVTEPALAEVPIQESEATESAETEADTEATLIEQ